MMQTEPPPHIVSSPSFSSYSSETFAQIAARVIHELRNDPLYHNLHHDDVDTLFDPTWSRNDITPTLNQNDDDNHNNNNQNDDDFEFSFVSRNPDSSPVSADDIFHNGQITPTYPLFGRDIRNGVASVSETETAPVRRRLPLRVLMSEERETASCSSSSEEEDEVEDGSRISGGGDLVGVDEGTYCVWTPRACKKSSSTRSSSSSSWSSRRWKLRDLFLLRSHSDGKEPMMLFVNPAKRNGGNKVAPKGNGSAGDGGAAAEKSGK